MASFGDDAIFTKQVAIYEKRLSELIQSDDWKNYLKECKDYFDYLDDYIGLKIPSTGYSKDHLIKW